MLGIKENNEPIDIKYLVLALRDTLKSHPEKGKFYASHMPEVYNGLIEYYKVHPEEFIKDFIIFKVKPASIENQQKGYLYDVDIQFKKK